jgi:hypothetical protein
VNVAVLELPFTVAVTATEVLVATLVVVRLSVAVLAPDGTSTEAGGGLTAPDPLAIVIATLVSVTTDAARVSVPVTV